MKSKNWIRKGFVLGAVFFVAVFFVKPIGVSTQFSVLSGIVHSTVAPDVITKDDDRETGFLSRNAYYDRSEGKLARSIKEPWNYDFVFVLAIPLGAFIMHLLMKRRRKDKVVVIHDVAETLENKKERTNYYVYLRSFAGGFILLYGARMANGCTSGHMMSGMMQGAVSGYIFAAAVFAVAIPTAILLGKRNYKKGGR